MHENGHMEDGFKLDKSSPCLSFRVFFFSEDDKRFEALQIFARVSCGAPGLSAFLTRLFCPASKGTFSPSCHANKQPPQLDFHVCVAIATRNRQHYRAKYRASFFHPNAPRIITGHLHRNGEIRHSGLGGLIWGTTISG